MSSRIVEDLFNTPIPHEVWHYTTLCGLEGILSTNSIWATEAHFTKDKSEFVHSLQVAIEFLETLAPTDGYIARARDTTLRIVRDAFEEGALSQEKTEVYVASFSAATDRESQWEEYADDGRGVSLAFDLREIHHVREIRLAGNSKLGVTLAPCIYLPGEKLKLLEAATSNLLQSLEAFARQGEDPQWKAGRWRDWLKIQSIYGLAPDRPAFEAKLRRELRVAPYDAYTSTLFDLLRLASHCKDCSFIQEDEWRLALPRWKNKPLTHNRIEYRGIQRNIPYLAHDLFRSGARLPITRIMVGPRCEDHGQIRRILDQSGYKVPICESKLSLRTL